ncbi:uncharacterized protein LOC121407464 [Lytechinus variegatus]|uniref:uncharacterized protein LOC121407464 n=1 Tax=Lytechinus variegatus TaxID=7654 RepID=UPI001BB2C885|nr:uncharacterized protein LOC121407464 [Lytechinus variegatus]
MCHMSMDRQTESFVCLGLIVILLQNTGRSQAECSKRFNDLSGQIIDTLHKDNRGNSRGTTHTSSCRYRVCAPPDHYIVLNITRLDGTPLPIGHVCLPRVVIKSGGPLGKVTTPLATLCRGEQPLPLVVQSQGNELRIVFRSKGWLTSTFQASFTFHKRTGPSSCIACPLVQKLNESMNASLTSQPQNESHSQLEVPDGEFQLNSPPPILTVIL